MRKQRLWEAITGWLKLVEGLYYKGLVDKETFEKVKAEYPEVFQAKGRTCWDSEKGGIVNDVEE